VRVILAAPTAGEYGAAEIDDRIADRNWALDLPGV
jgi:hypothetical protein